jgi:hypothetical protein
VAKKLSYQKIILRQDLKNNPNKVYIFGDNLEGKGFGGQAKEMRGEPNAVGIPTKKSPSMSEDSFFTDTEFINNKKAIDAAISKIPKGKEIVIPSAGLGTGRASLSEKAPKTYSYLKKALSDRVSKQVTADHWIYVSGAKDLNVIDANKKNIYKELQRVIKNRQSKYHEVTDNKVKIPSIGIVYGGWDKSGSDKLIAQFAKEHGIPIVAERSKGNPSERYDKLQNKYKPDLDVSITKHAGVKFNYPYHKAYEDLRFEVRAELKSLPKVFRNKQGDLMSNKPSDKYYTRILDRIESEPNLRKQELLAGHVKDSAIKFEAQHKFNPLGSEGKIRLEDLIEGSYVAQGTKVTQGQPKIDKKDGGRIYADSIAETQDSAHASTEGRYSIEQDQEPFKIGGKSVPIVDSGAGSDLPKKILKYIKVQGPTSIVKEKNSNGRVIPAGSTIQRLADAPELKHKGTLLATTHNVFKIKAWGANSKITINKNKQQPIASKSARSQYSSSLKQIVSSVVEGGISEVTQEKDAFRKETLAFGEKGDDVNPQKLQIDKGEYLENENKKERAEIKFLDRLKVLKDKYPKALTDKRLNKVLLKTLPDTHASFVGMTASEGSKVSEPRKGIFNSSKIDKISKIKKDIAKGAFGGVKANTENIKQGLSGNIKTDSKNINLSPKKLGHGPIFESRFKRLSDNVNKYKEFNKILKKLPKAKSTKVAKINQPYIKPTKSVKIFPKTNKITLEKIYAAKGNNPKTTIELKKSNITGEFNTPKVNRKIAVKTLGNKIKPSGSTTLGGLFIFSDIIRIMSARKKAKLHGIKNPQFGDTMHFMYPMAFPKPYTDKQRTSYGIDPI